MAKIRRIIAREILNSRGIPTIEAIVQLVDDSTGIYSVPSGTSVGKHEAFELRDGDKRFRGLGVLKALTIIATIISPKLIGMEAKNQDEIDNLMIALDGEKNKSHLGGNSILAISGAVTKAQSISEKMPLYQYIARLAKYDTKQFSMPTPMFNLINGGVHGDGNLDFQEFLVVPPKANTYSQNLKFGVEIYYSIKDVLQAQSFPTLLGDEGGYAPNLHTNSDVYKIFQEAALRVGYNAGLDIFFSLDVAANKLKHGGAYRIKDKPVPLSASDLTEYYISLNEQYHLLSLEDPFGENDWDDWVKLTEKLGGEMLIVGDDLTGTNLELLEKAIDLKACNCLVIKPNQIGTVSETLKVIKRAKDAGFKVIVSHRSQETNDDFIADFAVGVGADYAKLGAPARGERVSKYNRLLEIEHELS